MNSNLTFFDIQLQNLDENGYSIVKFNDVKLVVKNLSLVSNKSIELLVEVSQENKDKYQYKRAKRNLGFNDSQSLTNFQYEQIDFESLKIPNFYVITTWECVLFTESYMKLKLNFSDPDLVSLITSDTLKLKVLNEEIFQHQPNETLETNYSEYILLGYTTSSKITQPNPNPYSIQGTLQTMTTTTQIMIMSNMFMSTILSSSLSQVLGFVNSLQIILHYPLIKQSISYPYEVQQFYQNVISIAQFDYIPYNYSTALLFEFNEPEFDMDKFGQFGNLNYQHYGVISNLGSNFYYVCIFTIYPVFLLFLLLVQKLIRFGQSNFEGVGEFVGRQRLKMASAVPGYFVEGAFEILIAIYLNWQEPIKGEKLEVDGASDYYQSMRRFFDVFASRFYFYANDPELKLGDRLSFFSIFPLALMIFFIVPAYLIRLAVSFDLTEGEKKDQQVNKEQNSENLEKKQDADSSGKKSKNEPPLGLSKDMRCQTYYQRSFFFLFILRRIIYLFIVIQFEKNTQLCLMMFLNLLSTVYVSSAKVYIYKKVDNLQIYNELVISFTLYMTLVFTDYVEHQHHKTLMGYVLLSAIIGLNFFINFLLSGMNLFQKLHLIYQKIKNKLFPQEKLEISIDYEKEIPSSIFIMKKMNKVQNLSEEQQETLRKEQPTPAEIKDKLQIIHKAIQNKQNDQILNQVIQQQNQPQYKPANFQNPDESTRKKLISSQSRSLKSSYKLNKKLEKDWGDKNVYIVPPEQLALNKIARTQRQLAKELNMTVVQEGKEPDQTMDISMQDLNIFQTRYNQISQILESQQQQNQIITKGEKMGQFKDQF